MRCRTLLPVLVCLLAACGTPAPRPNVLLVTFDTTRADRIGCYGDELARTPTVDALAAEGVLFEEALTSVPITLPSHSTLMTGKVPFAHGVRDNGLFVLGDEQHTLAEILRENGYRTAAAIASFPLLGRFGIGQGFELYDDHVTAEYEDLYGDRVFPKSRLYMDERPAAQVNEAVLPWLEENHDQPFFLWLHYFDPHQPLHPPAPYDQLFAHDLYRGEIAYADESLGVVMERLRKLGVADETLVIFTADHGEGLGEHHESTHSMLLYQGTLHVPLVMRLPGGIAGRRVSQRVGLVDVLPTVLDLLGIEPPEGIQGRSLASYLTEAEEPPGDRQRELYAETLSPRLARNWGELRALVVDDHKYVHGPLRELFDLEKDPAELENLVDRPGSPAGELERRLAGFLEENAVAGLDVSVTIDEETSRRLQALGYLQGTGQAVGTIIEELRTDGEPPQKHSQNVSAYSIAKQYMFEGKLIEGKELILELLEKDPVNPNYLEMLFQAELRLGRPEAALAILNQLDELDAPFPPRDERLENAALLLLRQNAPFEALAKLQEAQEIQPTATRAYRLSTVHGALGQPADQRAQLESALALDPSLAPALIDLGISLAQEGDTEAAERHLRSAVERQPYDPRAHYNLGGFLVQTGADEEGIERFRRAIELSPAYLAAHYALFERLHEAGETGPPPPRASRPCTGWRRTARKLARPGNGWESSHEIRSCLERPSRPACCWRPSSHVPLRPEPPRASRKNPKSSGHHLGRRRDRRGPLPRRRDHRRRPRSGDPAAGPRRQSPAGGQPGRDARESRTPVGGGTPAARRSEAGSERIATPRCWGSTVPSRRELYSDAFQRQHPDPTSAVDRRRRRSLLPGAPGPVPERGATADVPHLQEPPRGR